MYIYIYTYIIYTVHYPLYYIILYVSFTIQYILVGGFNPSETYEFVSWDDGIANIMEKIKVMFQTTNQIIINQN